LFETSQEITTDKELACQFESADSLYISEEGNGCGNNSSSQVSLLATFYQ
jgi:hypothetical protein